MSQNGIKKPQQGDAEAFMVGVGNFNLVPRIYVWFFGSYFFVRE